MTTDHLAVGAIAGPHGVRGQFKVKLFAESPAALEQYGALQIDGGRALKLTVKSVNSRGLVIVSADGVTSREAAESLRAQGENAAAAASSVSRIMVASLGCPLRVAYFGRYVSSPQVLMTLDVHASSDLCHTVEKIYMG